MTKQPVLIEQTSKTWKALLAMGTFLVIVAIVLMASTYDDAARDWLAIPAFLGIGIALTGAFAGWWQTG